MNRARKKGLLEKRSSQNVHSVLENFEILEIPQHVENKGDSDHSLEIPESLEILEIPPVRRPLS